MAFDVNGDSGYRTTTVTAAESEYAPGASSHSTSGQLSQHGKREALRIGIPGRVLEGLLAGIGGKRHAVGVAELQIVAGDIEVQW